ncbi:HPr(Ser) kinase/phosphatase [Acanthopleuribacter pedis]|uniref:HPr(Ser) kinase/phosphatase n=1 Tax=Acanthopleuribacter pedis TaxID=442870 RepID=A0A8J7QCF8_9BACT|nr:HPr(Ser) kinase/phosphatase [Acanthopleuribacter pedis]MBO1318431.1 HPr(Ser) kinase/phosphatase [Acanthopleuribacter pedis]
MSEADRAPDGDYWQILSDSIEERGRRCRQSLTVKELLEAEDHLDLVQMGELGDLNREIRSPVIQRLGLALCGYCHDLEPHSLFLVGRAEHAYLTEQGQNLEASRLQTVLDREPGALLVSYGLPLHASLVQCCAAAGIPVLASQCNDIDIIVRLGRILVENLAPCLNIHGNLLVINGLGVLILGKSGIGKSDDSLDLIKHGHQLVADDIVLVSRTPEGSLIGRADELIQDHMEIRGLGIVNIKEIYGISSVLDKHPIELILYLETFTPNTVKSCFPEIESMRILDVARPLMRLSVAPGRSLENLIEIAVKHYLLSIKGYNTEKVLADRLALKRARDQAAAQAD